MDARNLDITETAALLRGLLPSWRLMHFEEIDSTNRYAKALATQDPDLRALIVADSQSAGRGRMGRDFYSPASTGLYFSLVFPAESALGSLPLTAAAAVAVLRAVYKLTGKQLSVKWVNDLLLNEKKVAGILCEGVYTGNRQSMVIGIGINVSTDAFPADLQAVAGSLAETSLSRDLLLREVCGELIPYIQDPGDRAWLSDYRTHSCVLGREIKWLENGVWQMGQALDMDADGALLVKNSAGEVCRLATGEITLRRL